MSEGDPYPSGEPDFPRPDGVLSSQGFVAPLMDALGWGPARRARKTRDELAIEADGRYDSMTPEQRERYYVHPNLWRRFIQFWRP
jgi:hypothetical protein